MEDYSQEEIQQSTTNNTHQTTSIRGMYQDWFLDYASYVILERAVPHINDGLKPVQRRILHSMKELDDGRYNKVANIVGNTMKYHPHGDASIYGATVQLGQKELMIDTQGNWGNILTGDGAAAARYIEARLSKFALEVAFDYQTTTFHPSYDGRNQEPDTLPIKFPLLLAQGAEGIAVTLACIILPHNFNELIDCSINILQNKPFTLYPDFITGGMIDVSKYNDGIRGGKLVVRAKIIQEDKKTLVIKEIPYSTTSDSLIESIVKATEKGQLKIKKIENNTAKDVEIRIHLPNDVSIDQTMDALYAFTDCELSISPNSCVIDNEKPCFMGVSDILRRNTERTVELLKKELEIQLDELKEKWQWISLEKIFIENEIYEKIKPCTTDEQINTTIFNGLAPFVKNLIREVTIEDVQKLRKIPIDRISKYNSDKANDNIKAIEVDMEEVKNNLEHLIDYAIIYFKHIKDKYGKGKERKTEIKDFEHIEVTEVAVANEKLYCNYKDGFAGFKLKDDKYVCDCSTLDDILVIRRDGTFCVKKVEEKDFVGKDVFYINVFHKNDERTIFNMVYQNGPFGRCYIKRFNITSVIRGRDYNLTQGVAGTEILYLSINGNGEAEKIMVNLKARPKIKKLSFEYDFAQVAIKNKLAKGVILSNYPVRKVSKSSKGISTLAARKIWFDDSLKRLNEEEKGIYLGEFDLEDKILSITSSGFYRILGLDFTLHFEQDTILVEKFNPNKPISIIYLENVSKKYFLKRFVPEFSANKVNIFEEQENAKLKLCLTDWLPVIKIDGEKKEVASLAEVTRYRAKGKRISEDNKTKFKVLSPIPYQEPEKIKEKTNDDDFFNEDNDSPIDDGIQGSLF